MNATTTGWTWRPLAYANAQARLERVLDSWRDTPYSPSQQQKGAGVDCVRFVCGVLDEMYRFRRVPLPDLPQDVALHKRKTAIAAMKYILRLYEPNFALHGAVLEPGDVLILGQLDAGPGHAMIVGARENELWHSTGARVQMTGIGFLSLGGNPWQLHGAYRLLDKERWE